MKIAEVRKLLSTYSNEQLQLIIAEIYKSIPKSIKDSKDIDELISNPDSLKKVKKTSKTTKNLDIFELEIETNQFIEDAYNQYYFAPNSVIHKKERPKWRFIVKRLYKSLLAVPDNENNLEIASHVLEKLYTLMCYSCSYTLFSGYDSFQSVGIEQSEFYRSVLSLKHKTATLQNFISGAIALILNNSLNRYTLSSELMDAMLEYIKTPDAREISIEICKDLLIKEKKNADNDKYKKKEINNHLIEIIFLCYRDLFEIEKGVSFYKKNFDEKDHEVKLYILLKWLFDCKKQELFLSEYNNAVNSGVKPRTALVEVVKTIQSTGDFPEYF